MYGMINRAIEDLVVSTYGVDKWEEVITNAGIETGQFCDSEICDDEITFKLVEGAAKVTGHSADAILEAFGRHWILFTGREDWACLFEVAAGNLFEFLSELDSLHSRVQTAMPDMRMPQFTVIDAVDESVIVEYRSSRSGLAPMVTGLLAGLAEYFDENVSIEQIGWRSENGYDSFHMRKVSEAGLREDAASAA